MITVRSPSSGSLWLGLRQSRRIAVFEPVMDPDNNPALPTAIQKARLLMIGSAQSRKTIQVSVRSSFTSHMSTDARVPGVSEGSIALNT